MPRVTLRATFALVVAACLCMRPAPFSVIDGVSFPILAAQIESAVAASPVKYVIARLEFIPSEADLRSVSGKIGYKLSHKGGLDYEMTRHKYDELRDRRDQPSSNQELLQIWARLDGNDTEMVVTFYHDHMRRAVDSFIPCGNLPAGDCAASDPRIERIVQTIRDHTKECHQGAPCNPINQRTVF